MKIVIDSNILFSALIKDSITRKLILEYVGLFLFPEYIFEEMEEHSEELFQKSGMNKEDFQQLFQLLLQKVIIVPNDTLAPQKEEAFAITIDIDENDTLFIACALTYHGSIIWSEDKKLKNQKRVTVMNT